MALITKTRTSSEGKEEKRREGRMERIRSHHDGLFPTMRTGNEGAGEQVNKGALAGVGRERGEGIGGARGIADVLWPVAIFFLCEVKFPFYTNHPRHESPMMYCNIQCQA